MSNTWKWIIGLGVGAFLLAHPFTRQIVKLILPLGSGWDDLVELALIIAFGYLVISRGWIKWEKLQTFRSIDRDKNTRVKQVAWVTLAIGGACLYPGFVNAITGLVMFARPIIDPSYIVVLVTVLILVVVGWNVISFIDKRSTK